LEAIMEQPGVEKTKWLDVWPVSSAPLRGLCWGLSLFASIVVTSLQVYPALAGRIVLGMIAGGFLLFALARASVGPERRATGCVAADLGAPSRVCYWLGYVLMVSGVALSVVVILV
jgi:hypothetical protein